MEFADIHIHLLADVDDGAKTEAEMYAMADAVYSEGTRILCATPHFHPGYFGDNAQKTATVYELLNAYIQERYPEMRLYLGNELRYSRDCIAWLNSGFCRTMNGSRFVLLDFSEREEEREIVRGLEKLLNAGYIPILAHVERYQSLSGKIHILSDLRANGVLLQVDAQSVTGGLGFAAKRRCKNLLSMRMADLISSDAHDLASRPPEMAKSYEYVAKRYGEEYAEALYMGNAINILDGKDLT